MTFKKYIREILTPFKGIMDTLMNNNYDEMTMHDVCKEYNLEEIDLATNGYSNIIGNGDYGVVYKGVLANNIHVVVKHLLINRCTIDEFKTKLKIMWQFKNRNLVKLLGFCEEGRYRMLVYEFVDNNNLSYWLHQNTSKFSPLSWRRRMSIVEGITKGISYLHEDLCRGIVHKHIKSSNILLDKYWNPKISDTRISCFLDYDKTYCMAPPMGMDGCSAPEYYDKRRTGAVVDPKSDVYSFGILLMEIVSGKTAVERSVTEIEQHLVEWIKYMVSMEKYIEILDPKLQEKPTFTKVKGIIEIALKCVDSNGEERPKMCEVVNMLRSHYYFQTY